MEMKVFACYVLHYGREWLYHSIRSVADGVDGFVFVYTGGPSFGHQTDLVCPDTQDQLFDISRRAVNMTDGKSWSWHDASGMHFPDEGHHRTYAVNACWKEGADLVLVVDADELWPENQLHLALSEAKTIHSRTWRVKMRHMWRSLHWICEDPAMPTRLILNPLVRPTAEEQYMTHEVEPFHMGYAQSSALIRYKMSIHGHKGEIRPGWFDNIFMPWSPSNPYGDVHPTCEHNFWDPKPFADEGRVLQGLTQGHPYWGMDLIP